MTINEILKIVCEYSGVTPEELRSKSKGARKPKYALVRQRYSYLCRKYTNRTFKQIGELINCRHSVVNTNNQKVAIDIATYKEDREIINELEKLCTKEI